ncbi:MAG: hypothetical protein WCS89_00125 [Candidatus Paceibacterota bacterium]|jgi:hypothetical protein
MNQIIEQAVDSLKQTDDAIATEKWRIINEFIELLRWIDKNVPKNVILPFQVAINEGIFRCVCFDTETEINLYSTNGPSLRHDQIHQIIRLVDQDFVGDLLKEIQRLTEKSQNKLEDLQKITVPQKL